jgi:hypothetical protein
MPVTFLMKLDQDGGETWFRPYGSELPHPSDTIYSGAYWVQETTDGGYVACGEYFSSSTSNICYLFHTDAKGELQWSRGFEVEELYHGFFVRQTEDGGYTLLVDGMETSPGIGLNGYLVHTDTLGRTSWTTCYPGEWYSYAAPTIDGGYILAGGKFEGPIPKNRLLKADALGNKLWAGTLGPAGATLISVQPTSDGGYIVTGAVPTPEVGGSAIYLAKLAPDVPRSAFARGDADASGELNITDAVVVLGYLFQSGPAPTCQDAADSDDNGKVNITDPIYVLGHLFLGGPAPGAPFGKCGADPTDDGLTCETHGACH